MHMIARPSINQVINFWFWNSYLPVFINVLMPIHMTLFFYERTYRSWRTLCVFTFSFSWTPFLCQFVFYLFPKLICFLQYCLDPSVKYYFVEDDIQNRFVIFSNVRCTEGFAGQRCQFKKARVNPTGDSKYIPTESPITCVWWITCIEQSSTRNQGIYRVPNVFWR